MRRPFKVYVRSLGDLVVCGVAFLSMRHQGAPDWALTLLVVVCTRASILATAMDLGELQRNIRRTREETVPMTHAVRSDGKRLPPP